MKAKYPLIGLGLAVGVVIGFVISVAILLFIYGMVVVAVRDVIGFELPQLF